MSTLVDVDTASLDALDFEPQCDCVLSSGRCENEASHRLVCIFCSHDAGIACIEHAIYARQQRREVTHKRCGAKAPLAELVIVEAL